VHTWTHADKAIFLAEATRLIAGYPDASVLAQKCRDLIAITIANIAGNIWKANTRIVLTSADGTASGEKTQAEFKTSLGKKLKDKRSAVRTKTPSPKQPWNK